jgi:hypothetical protein
LDEPALVSVVRHDGPLAGIATLEGRIFSIEPQAALLLLGSMTLQAMPRKDRLNVALELHGCGLAVTGTQQEDREDERH